jgi:hypothetical protein
MKRPCITEKIPREVTGLNGSLFVHVEFDDDGRIEEIRFSEKGKDDSTLDRILHALGDSVTAIVRLANAPHPKPEQVTG